LVVSDRIRQNDTDAAARRALSDSPYLLSLLGENVEPAPVTAKVCVVPEATETAV